MNLTDDLVAGITIKADNNLQNLFIDQAVVEWAVKNPATFILGQQTYNHGLLSSHLISDPSIKDIVEKGGLESTINLPGFQRRTIIKN